MLSEVSVILYSLQTCRTLRRSGLSPVPVHVRCLRVALIVHFILWISFLQSSIISSSITNDM